MTRKFKGFANLPKSHLIKFKDSPLAEVLQKLNNNWDYMVPALRKDIEQNPDLDIFTFTSKEHWDTSTDPRQSFYQITGGGGDFDKAKTYLKVETIFALVRSYEKNKSKMNFDIIELNELSSVIKSLAKKTGITHRQCWDALILSDKSFYIDHIIDYLLTGEEVNACSI